MTMTARRRVRRPARAAKKQQRRFDVETLAEVAQFFKVATSTVKQWREMTDPMPGAPGEWDLSEITAWRLRNARKPGSIQEEKTEAEIRLKNIQAERATLELETERGNLLPRRDVEQWAAGAMIEFRDGLMQLPDTIAGSSPPELKAFAAEESERHCRDLLTLIRKRLEAPPKKKTEDAA